MALGAAILAVAFIASFFGIFSAKANDTATPPATQQVLGRVETCKLNASSYCIVSHGLGVKPTAVVLELSKTKQTVISVDASSITDTSYKVTASVNGKLITTQPTITFSAVYTYVGSPVTTTPSPSPTATPTTTPTVTPTTTPTSTPTSAPTAISYTCNPTNTIAHFYPADSSNGQGQGSDSVGDPYNASAEQWAVYPDYRSNMCVYSKDKWYVEAKSINHGDGAVQAYPSMRAIYHNYGESNFNNDPKLSSFPQLKAEFAQTDPANCTGCIYNDAFDLWINGIGNGPGITELMIWTHNNGQTPYGNHRKTVTIDGITWDVFTSDDNGYIAYVPRDNVDIKSGTFDLKAFIQDSVNSKYIATTDPKVSQVSYGVEVVSTGKNSSGTPVFRRWDFTKFNLLDK
jgi:hypothetical protein